jgi:PTH2 family peptidyl-tRNA hydrolase
LPVVLIEDAGLTMFNGVKTKTCLAIGPAKDSEIDEITGSLKLL